MKLHRKTLGSRQPCPLALLKKVPPFLVRLQRFFGTMAAQNFIDGVRDKIPKVNKYAN
jgi:hypothetical protein